MENIKNSDEVSGVKILTIGSVPESALTPVYSINGNGGNCVWAIGLWSFEDNEPQSFGNFQQNTNHPMGFITLGTGSYLNSIKIEWEGKDENILLVRLKLTSNDGQVSEGGPHDGQLFHTLLLTDIRIIRMGFVANPSGPIKGICVEYIENYVPSSDEGRVEAIQKYALAPTYPTYATHRNQVLQSWAFMANALSVLRSEGLMDLNSLVDFYGYACALLRKDFPGGLHLGKMIEDMEAEMGAGEPQAVAAGNVAVYQTDVTVRKNGSSVWFYPNWIDRNGSGTPLTTTVVSTSAPSAVSPFLNNFDLTFSLSSCIPGLTAYIGRKDGVLYYEENPT